MKYKFTYLFVILANIFCIFFTHQLQAQPAYDDCNNALTRPVATDSANSCLLVNNNGATASQGVPDPFDPDGVYTGYNGKDVWFKFVAPESGVVYISTSTTTPDRQGGMALYSGDCNSLNQLILSTPVNSSDMPRIETEASGVFLTEGDVYFIRFWPIEGAWEDYFNICIWTDIVVVGNTCAEATLLDCGYNCNMRQFNNTGSTHSGVGYSNLCGNYSAQGLTGDVWFKTIVPENGKVIVTTEAGTLTNCAMALYTGTCTNLQMKVCNAGVSAGNPMPEVSYDNLVPGSTVYIRFWDKNCNEAGTFKICAHTPRPNNDDCSYALSLAAPYGSSCVMQSCNTYGARPTYSIPSSCATNEDLDLWYSVQAVAGMRLVINTQAGTVFGAGLALYGVYEGCEDGVCNCLYELDCVTGVNPEIAMQGFNEDQLLFVRFWTLDQQEGTYGICAHHTDELTVNMGEVRYTMSNCNENNPLIICDNGGSMENYGKNRNDTITIYADTNSVEQQFVQLEFLTFDVDSTDTLFIYNASVAEPEYLTFKMGNLQASWLNNSNAPIISEGFPLKVSAFYYGDTTGAITLRFKSDGDDSTKGGFRIMVTCTQPCKPIYIDQAAMDLLIEPTPHFDPEYADGFKYIDICPDPETDTAWAHFKAVVSYPIPNNEFYEQYDSTSLFTWYMGKEVISGIGLTELNYGFVAGQGTTAALSVSDVRGCLAPNVAVYRVRVSKNPINEVNIPNVCAGENLDIVAGRTADSCNIFCGALSGGELTTLKVQDTVFLPDGVYCPPHGCSYISSVVFTAFNPTATIRTADDILWLRILMEHSFIGDIYIRLVCPNGNYAVILKKYEGGHSDCSSSIPSEDWGWLNGSNSAGAYLGNPVDDWGEGCTPTPMGTGWNYCWSNSTDQGYVYAPGDGVMYRKVNVHEGKVDSTNVAEMTNVYHPDESFVNLIGCPLNGAWSIEVMDGYHIDNGYLFGWELSLNPELLPSNWQFSNTVKYLENEDDPYIERINDTTLRITPPANTPDTIINYTFTIVDKFGCEYDTSVDIRIYPSFNDVSVAEICAGLPYEGHGFYIENPPASVLGNDTVISVSKYNLQTIHGCDSAITLELTVHPNKEVFFNGVICEGETYNDHGFNVTGYAEGEWIYRNVGVTQYGCDTVTTLYLTVQETPDVEILGVLNLCKGASTTLTASGCTDNNCTYLWSTGETTPSIEVTPEEDTEYSVTMNTSAYCSGFAAVTVSVSNYLTPDLSIEGDLEIICGDAATLTAVDNNNVAINFVWRENGEIIEGATGSSVTVYPNETSVYSVTATSEHNCIGNVDATIVVGPTSIGINASATTINYSESTTLSANNITGVPSTYVWTWGDTTATGESIVVSPTSNTTYYLEATTIENGCKAYAEITIFVVYIFSPPETVDPQFFSGVSVDSSCRAIVHWTAPDPNQMQAGGVFIGYNVYRDNILITPTPIQADSLLDIQLPEGTYVYCVECVYETGISEKVCGSIDFNAEYHAPDLLLTSRTEDCNASLIWNTPRQNCWANLNGYYIYRNDVLIDSIYTPKPVIDTLFTDKNIGESRFNYCVQAFYTINDQTHVSDKICTMINTCYNVAVNVYPNPVDKEITITANEMERIMIYDESGRFLHQINVPENACRTIKISTAHLANGVHLFHIFMRGDISTIKRVIIMH